MIKTLDDSDFGGKIDCCGGRKTGESGEKTQSQIEINQSQPMYEPRIEPRSLWWDARMMGNVTPLCSKIISLKSDESAHRKKRGMPMSKICLLGEGDVIVVVVVCLRAV